MKLLSSVAFPHDATLVESAASDAAAAGLPLPLKVWWRPSDIGDLLDRAVLLYRAYFRKFFVMLLYYGLFSALMTTMGRFGMAYVQGQIKQLWEHRLGDVDALSISLQGGQVLIQALMGASIINVLSLLSLLVMVGAVTSAVWRVLNGQDFTVGGAYRQSFRKAKPLLFTTVAGLATLYAAGMAGLVPGYLLFLTSTIFSWRSGLIVVGVAVVIGAMLGVVVALAKIIMTPFIIMVEDRQGLDALLRSARMAAAPPDSPLKRHPIVRTSIILTVLSSVWLAYGAFITIPNLTIMYLRDFRQYFQDPGQIQAAMEIPLYWEMLLVGVGVVYTALVLPYLIIGMVLYYHDLRLRQGGVDFLRRRYS